MLKRLSKSDVEEKSGQLQADPFGNRKRRVAAAVIGWLHTHSSASFVSSPGVGHAMRATGVRPGTSDLLWKTVTKTPCVLSGSARWL
jgi:hypothetical protein